MVYEAKVPIKIHTLLYKTQLFWSRKFGSSESLTIIDIEVPTGHIPQPSVYSGVQNSDERPSKGPSTYRKGD